MTEVDSADTSTATISKTTALALHFEARELEANIETMVREKVSTHLKASIDGDVPSSIDVEDGVEIPYQLTDRQESMIAVVGEGTGVNAFVTAAIETRTTSSTEQISIELPGTVIAALDAAVDAGSYATRSKAVRHAFLIDVIDTEDSHLDAVITG